MRERAKATALMQCFARMVMGLSLLVFVAVDGAPAWRGQIFAVSPLTLSLSPRLAES